MNCAANHRGPKSSPLVFEHCEQRLAMTTVYIPEAIPSAAISDAYTPLWPSAVLEDGSLAFVTYASEGLEWHVSKPSGNGYSTVSISAAITDFSGGSFSGNGTLALAGKFSVAPGAPEFAGYGVYLQPQAEPDYVFYLDDAEPTVSYDTAGILAPGSSTLRVAMRVLDPVGEINRNSISLETLRLTSSGSSLTPVSYSIAGTSNYSEHLITFDFALPVLPKDVTARAWSAALTANSLKDRAGNSASKAAQVVFTQKSQNSKVWTDPPPPESLPAIPWLTVTTVGTFAPDFGFLNTISRMSVADSGSVIALGAQVTHSPSGRTETLGIFDFAPSGVTFRALPESVPVVAQFSEYTKSGAVAMLSTDGSVWRATSRTAPFTLVLDPDAQGINPASVTGISLAEDGRVGALIASPFPTVLNTDPAAILYLLYMATNGQWEVEPVCGTQGDGVLDTPETFIDLNSDGEVDPGEDSLLRHAPLASGRAYVRQVVGGVQRYSITYQTEEGIASVTTSTDKLEFAIGPRSGVPEAVLFSGIGVSNGSSVESLYYGAESPGAARTFMIGEYSVAFLNRPLAADGTIGVLITDLASGAIQPARILDLGLRPVIVVPGIFASMPAEDQMLRWVTTRGMSPLSMVMEPIASTYDDLLESLSRAGHKPYRSGSAATLYAATYDWRLPPAPIHEVSGSPLDGPWQRVMDGAVTGLGINSLGAQPTFQHGVDYLAWWLREAKTDWEFRNPGYTLPSVDVYAHSTGGIVTRAYIQSDRYGAYGLPKVNRFVSMAVPHLGASKAWNLLHNNLDAGEDNDLNPAKFYQNFVGGLVWSAYQKVMVGGESIRHASPELVITKERVEAAATAFPELYAGFSFQESCRRAFISLYIVTGRALLATYPFLFTSGASAPSPLPSNSPERNTLLLDMNGGAELVLGLPRSASTTPATSFGNLLGRTELVVIYTASTASTFVYAEELIGPFFDDELHIPYDDINPFDTESRAARRNEKWWWDHEVFGSAPDMRGDGTVPALSAGWAFERAGVRVHRMIGPGLDHNSMNSDAATQLVVLSELGVPMDENDISGALYGPNIPTFNGYAWAFTGYGIFWRDPVGAYVVDGLGRRAGWTPAGGWKTEIPGSSNYGGEEGFTAFASPLVEPVRLEIVGIGPAYAIRSSIRREDGTSVFRIHSGGIAPGATRSIAIPPTSDAATAFIDYFNAIAIDGLVDGDGIAERLRADVEDRAYGQGYWGGENYWFQDTSGDVYSLWHGGSIHALPEGGHRWILTNLTEAAGLAGQMSFSPGSLSGLATGWNAFNVQGISGGRLWALWWSPEGSAGTYLDTDGTAKQGKALGLRGNGWSLSSISDALTPINSAIDSPPTEFRGWSMSQGNSRTDYDPRDSWYTANNGMSVIVVDTSDRVFAVSFNIGQRQIAGARPELNGQWLVERLADVPSLASLGILGEADAFEAQFVSASKR